MSGIARRMMQAGGEVDPAWNLSFAYYDSRPWDVSTASFVQSFSISGQGFSPAAIFFKPDGAKMYVISAADEEVNEYDLSTAWDVSTASYLQNFSVSAQETSPRGLFFKPDGTKMYVVGSNGDDVNEYDLSTAWDVSSASYLQNFSVAAQDTAPQGLFFKPDGTKMYVVGLIEDYVNEYDLSTAWDISSASFLQKFSVSAQETSPSGLFFKPDGTKMYVVGTVGDDVNEYDLSTAWDVSSASYLQNVSVADQDGLPQGLFFKPDGTKMYVVGAAGFSVYEYNLGPFSVKDEETAPQELFFKPDGLKMYVLGSTTTDAVNEYDLSTAWDVSTASYLQNFSVAAQDGTPLGLFFKPDGTKMYITGNDGDDVNEYDLSTAWDVSSASFVQSFSVAAQETFPSGVSFKPDGNKMYVIGASGDAVNEYDLSTAWDVSTASFLQNFSVAAQETGPRGLFFRSDGLKMYIVGTSGDDVNEYNLSTAWDISSASFLQNFSVAAQAVFPVGLFFKPDGLKMYVLGQIGDAVYTYTIGIQ